METTFANHAHPYVAIIQNIHETFTTQKNPTKIWEKKFISKKYKYRKSTARSDSLQPHGL